MSLPRPSAGALFSWAKQFVVAQNEVNNAAILRSPTGAIVAWPLADVPVGWLACDGAEYLIASYPVLGSILADTWGSPSTAEYFVTPDFTGAQLSDVPPVIWIIRT
jgi:hypothetical protein